MVRGEESVWTEMNRRKVRSTCRVERVDGFSPVYVDIAQACCSRTSRASLARFGTSIAEGLRSGADGVKEGAAGRDSAVVDGRHRQE